MSAPDVDELAEALHEVMCDVSHHDRGASCSRWARYPAIARSAVAHWPTPARRAPVQGQRDVAPAERIAERGGFGYRELQCAIARHYNETGRCRRKHPVPAGWQPR